MFIECLLCVSHCNQRRVTLKIIVDYVKILKRMFSVTKLGLTLWISMDWSVLGFSVLDYFPEFAQTHVCWIGDAIQPSHPLLPSSPFVFSVSQQKRSFPPLPIRWLKYWSFCFSISPSNEYLVSFTGWISLQCKGLSRQHYNSNALILQCSAFFFFWSNPHIHTWLLE